MHPPAQTLPQQLRTALPILALVWIPSGALLICAAVQTTLPTPMMFRDPAAVAELPAYTGAFSYLGVLLWAAAATVCLFTYMALPAAVRGTRAGGFILWSGLLTAVLTVDDLYQVHEGGVGHPPDCRHLDHSGLRRHGALDLREVP